MYRINLNYFNLLHTDKRSAVFEFETNVYPKE